MKRSLYFSPRERIETRSKAEQRWRARRGDTCVDGSFRCIHCSAQVVITPFYAGVLNRNHCPYCLWSRHLDLFNTGDRLCACKAPMRPLGLTMKQSRKKYAREDGGELMLIHACDGCGGVSINRIAADDLAERIYAVYERSLQLDEALDRRLDGQPIRLLVEGDRKLVRRRLFGRAN